jgi:ATP-dependent exoDNAse (exonuclease V) alpha subunit
MITVEQIRSRTIDLVCEADDAYERVLLSEPTREPLARLVRDEAIVVYGLAHSGRLTAGLRAEIAARLVKALVLSEALRRPLQ